MSNLRRLEDGSIDLSQFKLKARASPCAQCVLADRKCICPPGRDPPLSDDTFGSLFKKAFPKPLNLEKPIEVVSTHRAEGEPPLWSVDVESLPPRYDPRSERKKLAAVSIKDRLQSKSKLPERPLANFDDWDRPRVYSAKTLEYDITVSYFNHCVKVYIYTYKVSASQRRLCWLLSKKISNATKIELTRSIELRNSRTLTYPKDTMINKILKRLSHLVRPARFQMGFSKTIDKKGVSVLINIDHLIDHDKLESKIWSYRRRDYNWKAIKKRASEWI